MYIEPTTTIIVTLIGLWASWKLKNGFKNKVALYVQRVVNPYTTARGLMWRKSPLKHAEGMLFDKGRWSNTGFWMKNTYIPLDILFLDDKYKVLGIITNMVPHDETIKSTGLFWRYAIEINAGSVSALGININDYIEPIDTI